MMARSGLGWRLASAGVLVPILLVFVLWFPPVALHLLALAFAAVAGWEGTAILLRDADRADRVERAFGTTMTVAVTGLAAWAALSAPAALAAVFPAVFVAAMILLVFRPREVESFAPRAAALAFVPLYVGLGLAVLPAFRYLFPDGGRLVVLLATVTFFGDTGAYFAGRFLGRRRLHERLSPNKTWEGAVGGILGSTLAAVLAKVWYLPWLEWIDVAIIPPVTGTIGQIGDLFESALKRSVGVKDSGTVLPGHGGMLDRIDALIPAGFVVLAYFLLRPLWIGVAT